MLRRIPALRAVSSNSGWWRVSLLLFSMAFLGALLAIVFHACAEDYHAVADTSSWHHKPSGQECKRNDMVDAPLVVISMDGFAASYLNRHVTPAIDAFSSMGSRAEFIYPTFPSRTFVNHYAMATGLWADSHGIVDNNIWDPSISDRLEDMAKTQFDSFFRGEPIWSYAKRLGKRTACLNWLGCDRNISGFMPDINPDYNASLSTLARIDMVLEWLNGTERPALSMVYLAQPDEAGHFQNTSHDVSAALMENDAAVERLMSGLDSLGLLDCVNVLIVSDHGMSLLRNRIYWDEYIPLQNLVAVYGVVGRIYHNSSSGSDSSVTAPFSCKGGSDYRLYSRGTIPLRYHYSALPRIGDFIFEGRPGTTFYATKGDTFYMAGDHGYDPTESEMRTVFFARGPSIRSRLLLAPFQNIEYFHIFETLLGIPHSMSTNGTIGVADEMFVRKPTRPSLSVQIQRCPSSSPFACDSPCNRRDPWQLARLTNRVAACTSFLSTVSPISSLSQHPSALFCLHHLCDTLLIRGLPHGIRIVHEPVSSASLLSPTKQICAFGLLPGDCESTRISAPLGDSIDFHSLLLSQNSDFTGALQWRVPLSSSFVRTFLTPLTSLISSYAARFGRLVVISGTAYDHDHDGIADAAPSALPSHIFRIIISCPTWRGDGLGCFTPSETRVLPFVLPHTQRDLNCLNASDLLFAYTSRVADIEVLTGLHFFSDSAVVPEEIARRLRTFVSPSLW